MKGPYQVGERRVTQIDQEIKESDYPKLASLKNSCCSLEIDLLFSPGPLTILYVKKSFPDWNVCDFKTPGNIKS